MIQKIEAIVPKNSDKLTKAEYLIKTQKGEMLLQRGRHIDAEKIFQELLEKMKSGMDYDSYNQGYILWNLGRCMSYQDKSSKAIEYHRKAIAIFDRFKESEENSKQMLGVVYTDLSYNLLNLGLFDDGKKACQNGLNISKAVNNHRQVGMALSLLGEFALISKDIKQARTLYTEALKISQKLGEPQLEGNMWYDLGRVAKEAKNWNEAERYFRESLRIKESINDLYGIPQTCNELGLIAKNTGRHEDAERWYLTALEGFEKTKQLHAIAVASSNLAGICLFQSRLNEAEQYAQRAKNIFETLEVSSETWKSYRILAIIAEKRGIKDEVKKWRHKEYESIDAFAGTQCEIAPIVENFKPVIEAIVAACNGNEKAKAAVEAHFDDCRKGNWQIVEPIQRIWNGERDEEKLTADIDFNSRAIVLAILSVLSGKNPFEAER